MGFLFCGTHCIGKRITGHIDLYIMYMYAQSAAMFQWGGPLLRVLFLFFACQPKILNACVPHPWAKNPGATTVYAINHSTTYSYGNWNNVILGRTTSLVI